MTTTLETWAQRWGVPHEALADLTQTLTAPVSKSSKGESDIVSQVRLQASQEGWRLFRNNVGACYDRTGRFIRYGLANDSKKLNDVMKSSDLIGIRPLVIDPTFLGRTIGQFVAIECKASDWTYTGSPREKAQQHFLTLIAAYGGYARFSVGGL